MRIKRKLERKLTLVKRKCPKCGHKRMRIQTMDIMQCQKCGSEVNAGYERP